MGNVRFYGQMRKNVRRRDGMKDPHLLGFAVLSHGKRISLAGWTMKDDERPGELLIELTVRGWASASRSYCHGALYPAQRLFPDSPNMLGGLRWGGMDYSVAAWINVDNTGNQFLKLTLEPDLKTAVSRNGQNSVMEAVDRV